MFVDWGLVRNKGRAEPIHGVAHGFGVAKSIPPWRRIVFSCNVSKYMMKPPKPDVPRPKGIIEYAMEYSIAHQVD